MNMTQDSLASIDTTQSNGDNNVTRRSKISIEKKEDIVRQVIELDQKTIDVVDNVKVNHNSIRSIVARYKKTKTIQNKKKGGSDRSVRTPEIVNLVDDIVSHNSQYTLVEIKAKVEETVGAGFTISVSTINRCLKDLCITMKLTHREYDMVNHPEKVAQRKVYAQWFNSYIGIDQDRVVFVDESSFNQHIRRSQGRSYEGTRAIALTPTARGRNISFIASMTNTGMQFCKTVTDSTVTGALFAEYLLQLCT